MRDVEKFDEGKIRELKALGMSDGKVARIIFGYVDEWSLLMVDLATPTGVKLFFEHLFFYQDEFEDKCFLRNRVKPLIQTVELGWVVGN